VGKDQVAMSREMHWLRIDTYFTGEGDAPNGIHFEPMLCQHCEKAPCELVCPVEATSHSAEGINEMTYNRCIGTRYCSNNCPYKVRRFNFLEYHDRTTPVLKLMRNPTVTVRKRGVMEKCTYCVQRLNRTRIEMKKAAADAAVATTDEDRRKQGTRMDDLMGHLQTACQQACPTEAIIFGDMNYKFANGAPTYVTQLKSQPQNFGLLTELNTQPRTTYLPRLRNSNPALA
jgi:Fe-S-cluster-containing dehydrogenase component